MKRELFAKSPVITVSDDVVLNAFEQAPKVTSKVAYEERRIFTIIALAKATYEKTDGGTFTIVEALTKDGYIVTFSESYGKTLVDLMDKVISCELYTTRFGSTAVKPAIKRNPVNTKFLME